MFNYVLDFRNNSYEGPTVFRIFFTAKSDNKAVEHGQETLRNVIDDITYTNTKAYLFRSDEEPHVFITRIDS